MSLSYWDNTVAVGSENKIIILDTIAGSQLVILSEHAELVNSVTFSSDGKLLVSGSEDKTVKLWDVQTGGVVRTFHGHTNGVLSVSISTDHTRIASGSADETICLWDIQTGDCHCIIQQQDAVYYVNFSPTDPQHIFSISGDKVWQWDVNGHQISPTYNGSHIALSSDHAQFALCYENFVTVHNSDSRAIVAEFHIAESHARYCCFSPDGKLIAAAATDGAAYVWDITNPDPHPIETLDYIHNTLSLVFSSPSSLISGSINCSIKFWQIGALSTDLIATDLSETDLRRQVWLSSLQARAGIVIASYTSGMVRIWDIITGFYKGSFKSPADSSPRDVQLIDGRLIVGWYKGGQILIWENTGGELIQTIDAPPYQGIYGLRISGDGSKVFCLTREVIQAWSIHTGELVGEVEFKSESNPCLGPQTDGSKIWIQLNDSLTQGWDFGISGSPPVLLSNESVGRPLLEFICSKHWGTGDLSCIRDTTTGKEVFRFSREWAKPEKVQWDGQYMAAGYNNQEVLILDFHHMYQ